MAECGKEMIWALKKTSPTEVLIDTSQWRKPCLSFSVCAKTLAGRENFVDSSDPSKASQGKRHCRVDTACVTEGRTAFKLTY